MSRLGLVLGGIAVALSLVAYWWSGHTWWLVQAIAVPPLQVAAYLLGRRSRRRAAGRRSR